MSHTPDPAPTPTPGPPGFIPVLPPRSRTEIDAGVMPSHYDLVPRSPGVGGAARDLADANRHDALMALIAEADSIAGMSYSRLTVRDRQSLREAAARARIAFGVS